MTFSIYFLDEPPYLEEGAAPAAHGLLTVGNFKEGLYSCLLHWSQQQYIDHWREAVLAIVNGAGKSALIVNFATPNAASHLEWWPMYREGDTVHLQNHLLFFDQLKSPCSTETPLASLRDRETVSENGEAISEWQVELADLEWFLRTGARS